RQYDGDDQENARGSPQRVRFQPCSKFVHSTGCHPDVMIYRPQSSSASRFTAGAVVAKAAASIRFNEYMEGDACVSPTMRALNSLLALMERHLAGRPALPRLRPSPVLARIGSTG